MWPGVISSRMSYAHYGLTNLDLGNVVTYVVDHMHVEVVGCRVEHLGKCLLSGGEGKEGKEIKGRDQ